MNKKTMKFQILDKYSNHSKFDDLDITMFSLDMSEKIYEYFEPILPQNGENDIYFCDEKLEYFGNELYKIQQKIAPHLTKSTKEWEKNLFFEDVFYVEEMNNIFCQAFKVITHLKQFMDNAIEKKGMILIEHEKNYEF